MTRYNFIYKCGQDVCLKILFQRNSHKEHKDTKSTKREYDVFVIYLLIAHIILPLITAVTGIAISVKVCQNFELCAYLADKADCFL